MTGVMRIQIIANGRQAQAQLAAIQQQMRGFNRTMGAGTIAGQNFQRIFHPAYLERWAKNLQWTGRQIEFNFTLPLAIAGGFATKWALEVETAMTRLRKVYGDHSMSAESVREDTEDLGRAFEALSNHFGVVQSEVAGIGATWAQVGAEGVAVAKGTQSTLELMILGEMEAEEATRALIAVQAQYQLGTEELTQAVADLNAVENNTAATLPDLVRVIERSGAAARNAGVPISELAALTASLVPATGRAERAGNALRTIITRLMVPTGAARDLFREIGIEVDTAGWNSLNFRERLFRLASTFNELNTAQRAAVSTQAAGVFQVSRFGTIMQDIVDPMGRYQAALDATSDSTQTLNDYTKEITTYLASDPQGFRILTARLQNLAIRVIGPLIPALLGVFSRVVRLAEAFANLDPRLQQIILGGLALIAIVGPLLRYVGAFGLLIVRVGSMFKGFYGMLVLGSQGMGILLGATRNLITGFIGLPVVATRSMMKIGGLGARAGALLWTGFVTFHGLLVRLLTGLPSILGPVWTAMVAGSTWAWRAITASSVAAFNGLAWFFANFPRLAVAADQAIGRAMAATSAAMARLWVATGTAAATAYRTIGATLAAVWTGVNTAILAVWGATVRAVVALQSGAMRVFLAGQLIAYRAIGRGLVAAILLPLGRVLTTVQVLFTQAMMRLPGIAYGIWYAVGAAAEVISVGVVNALTVVGRLVRSGMSVIATGFLTGVYWMMEYWLRLTAFMRTAWVGLWPALAAITRRGIALLAASMRGLWAVFVALPVLLARLPALLTGLLVSARLFVVNFLRTIWLLPGGVMAVMRAVAVAVRIGGGLLLGGLLSWPALIATAVAAIAVVFREQIGRAIDWLSEKFFDLPRAANAAVRMVIDFFKEMARQVAQLIRFIFNPFAGFGGSSGGARAAATSAVAEPQRMATGGDVKGKGFGDTVPALLTPGEFVITRDGGNLGEALAFFKDRGADVVTMARGGAVAMRRYQAGGAVTDLERSEIARMTNIASVARQQAPSGSAVIETNTPEIRAMTAEVDRLETSVDGLESQVDAANRAIEDQQLILDDLRDTADATRAQLDAAQEAMDAWANTPIEGMRAMSDAIFENEMAQKQLRLEMLRIEEANGPIKDVQDRLNALGSDIESLYSERASLMSLGAGSDVLGVIDDRIASMEAEYHQLENATGMADSASAKYKELEAELERLQRRGEILNLEESLAFDPLTRQIEQAANAMEEMPFETILANVQHYRSEVERLTPVYERQSAAVEAQQEVIDNMTRSRDELQRVLDDEQALLEDVGGAATAAVDAFRDLAGAEDWDIPGGSMEGFEDLGSIDDFIAQLQQDMEDEFGNLDLFGPIRKAWDTTWERIKENAAGVWGAVIGAMVGGAAGLGTALLGALGISTVAGTIGGAIAGPLGMAIGAALGAAVGIGIQWLRENVSWDEVTAWFAESPFGRAWESLMPPIREFIDKFREIWRDFTGLLGDELEKWGPVLENAKGAFENVVSAITKVWNWLVDAFTTEGTALNTFWNWLWGAITNVILPVARMIGEVLIGVLAVIRNIFGFIFALIDGDWRAMWGYLGGIFTSAWDVVFGLLRGVGGVIAGIVRSLVEGVVGFFQWLYDKLVGGSIVPDLINGVVDWFAGLPGRVVAFVTDMVSRVTTFFTNMWNKITEIMSSIRDSISERLSSIVTRIREWISDIKERWSSFWDGLFTKASEVAGTILEKVRSLLGWNGGLRDLISSAVTAIGTLWDRIKAKFADPINFVIRTVYNRGIRRLWNYVAEKVGLGTLAEVEEIKLKRGGQVPGVGAMDTVPALLTPGEFVVTATGSNLGDALAYYGQNQMTPPPLPASAHRGGDEAPRRYAEGGVVGSLRNLNPTFLGWLRAWSNAIQTRIRVTSGWRSREQQARLYAQKPGLAAPPGRSNHEWGLAADIVPQLGGTYKGGRARDFNMRFPMSYEPWHIEPINARAMRTGTGGGGFMGWLMEAVGAIASRFLGPVRAAVSEFRDRGPIQNLLGAGADTLMDAAVDWLRNKEQQGELMPPSGIPGGTNPRQEDYRAAQRDRRANVNLGRTIADVKYGWTGGQWSSLHQLWQRESNWNHLARNPSSGAYGIPQALPANKMASHGSNWRTSPRTQILWGADYIKNRYRTPTEALRAWYSRSPHWYAAGGLASGRDVVPAMLTPGEFVVTATGSNLPDAVQYFNPQYMAAGGPVVSSQTVTASPGNFSHLQASDPVKHEDNRVTENHYHFGDLSFPNVRSGDDAEVFVRNLATIVGGSD